MGGTPTFRDHFSASAATYSRYRPRYPDALFGFLSSLCAEREVAWDCGCGNGQAAVGLAPWFRTVRASDPSAKQIAMATPCANVAYTCTRAEESGLADASCDLIAAAQAAHWFAIEAFYEEARRVSKPAAIIALIGYRPMRVDAALDAVIDHFHATVVGPYWPPERAHVDAAYRSLPFPFDDVTAPTFAMSTAWDLDHVLGYLGTWSAVSRYRKARGADPIDLVVGALRQAWGDPAVPRPISWPIHLRVGRVFGK